MSDLKSTSGLVKITSARNASGIVRYNMKTTKTEGKWKQQDKPVHQKDLVGFYGTASHPGLSLNRQGNLFALQTNNNARMANLYNGNTKHRMMYDNLPNRLSTCHTIVQSFDYDANPNLRPKQVHRMGEQLLVGVKKYLKSRYNYNLDAGMISTHIDDNKDIVRHGQEHQKHLHNHIVIMSYNDSGQSISPYLRIPDLYCFKQINDRIASENGLKDYYFKKLEREIKPNSSFSKSRAKKTKTSSNLQKAVQRFSKANNQAFDIYPSFKKYTKALKLRNQQLNIAYGYKKRDKKDTRTHQKRRQFTMDDFHSKQNKQRWYNINNLRLLAWKNKHDEKCERLIKEFNLNKLGKKALPYKDYLETMRYGLKKLPKANHLDSKKQRKHYQVSLKIHKYPKSSNKSKRINDFTKYLRQIDFNNRWKKSNHNPYNPKTGTLDDDFIVNGFGNLANMQQNQVANKDTNASNNGQQVSLNHEHASNAQKKAQLHQHRGHGLRR